MGAFSIFGKNKQVEASSGSEFYSHAEEEPAAPRRRSKRREEASDAFPDPALPEKKRARRRLVGAVALVLAAVIGLPMILDSEPKLLAGDIAIQIPSKDKPLPIQQQAADPLESSVALPPPDRHDPVEPAPQPPAPQSAPQSAQTATDGIAQGPALKAVPKKLESPVVAKEAPKPAEKTKPDAGGKAPRLVVQVAAVASPEKAAEVQNRLKAAGVKSFTQKVATQSGEKIRIRVGPFTSREEADKMRARLTKLGYSTTLVPV